MNYIAQLHSDFRNFLDEKSDPRTTNWFLITSPIPIAASCLIYVFIVKVLGPKLMKNRKPFELKNFIIIYNFLQVLFSLWLFYEAAMSGWLTGYSYRCEAIDYSPSPAAMRMANFVWWYYFSKFVDFIDTFLFVMRKKLDNVSALHVIHHGTMPFAVWWAVKFTPGGHVTFAFFINSGIHVVMYTYYMLAAMGPKVQRYLWWKKYITIMQIIQFIAMLVHSSQLIIWNPCHFPLAMLGWIDMHILLFLILFVNFYSQSYKKKAGREEGGRGLKMA